MNPATDTSIRAAQVVVPCTDLAASLDFFIGRLGFRVDLIFPADSPATAVVSGHGVCLRLVRQSTPLVAAAPFLLRLFGDRADPPETIQGPDGVRIEWASADSPVVVPNGTQEFVLTRNDAPGAWGEGRAGMLYRDLIPGRLGGRFVASHIRIPAGGEVPDYVHFHRVRFQLIFCKAGWVRVVYEDQGPPFVLQAGDCVLQPPEIRHRVLEASPGLEVIEFGCPAVHDTVADHVLALPTLRLHAVRSFNGQRFVRHVDANAAWVPWRVNGEEQIGFEAADTGIGVATSGLADVQVVRSRESGSSEYVAQIGHSGEVQFLFVLEGALELEGDAANSPAARGRHALGAGDSAAIPSAAGFSMRAQAGLRLLSIAL